MGCDVTLDSHVCVGDFDFLTHFELGAVTFPNCIVDQLLCFAHVACGRSWEKFTQAPPNHITSMQISRVISPLEKN